MSKPTQTQKGGSDKVTIELPRKAAEKWLDTLEFAEETLNMDANSAAVDPSLRKQYAKCAVGIGAIYGAVLGAVQKKRAAGLKAAIGNLDPVRNPIKEHQ